MKKLFSIIGLLLIVLNCKSQQVPVKIVKRYRHIIDLIQRDRATELAGLVVYPMARPNPLPEIGSAKKFIAYYPRLFDTAFKNKLQSFRDSDIFSHDDTYGLVGGQFTGDIWLNSDGKIVAINYNSEQEQSYKNNIAQKIKSRMHPSVNKWLKNIVVLKSAKLLLRIDETMDGLRYVLWSHGRSSAEKPDIILYHGKAEAQGTQGGWTYTFKNGNWTYRVDDVEMGENFGDMGYFLNVMYKGVLKSKTKLKEIKE